MLSRVKNLTDDQKGMIVVVLFFLTVTVVILATNDLKELWDNWGVLVIFFGLVSIIGGVAAVLRNSGVLRFRTDDEYYGR